MPALTHSLEAPACAACHPAQAADWGASLHAQAFSPGLTGQLLLFGPDEQRDCMKCHAPRAEQQARWVQDRQLARIEGVDCAACHVRRFTRFGPRAIPQTPHGEVREEPLFRDSAFCAPCHQFGPDGLALNGKPLENTYREWRESRYAREGVTCQSCHLPEGRHAFRGIHDPEMVRRGLRVRIVRDRDGLRLTATNAGAGHALPTYTTPRIRLTLEGPRATRERIIGRALAWDPARGLREVSDTRLAPGASVVLTLALAPDETGRARVTVDPGYDYHMRIYPDLLAAAGGRLADDDAARLRAAREMTRDLAYGLYEFRCPAWRGSRAEECAPPLR